MTEQATLPPPTEVDGPGVYSIPVADYHADPVPGGSLSSTGARKLLPPSCPALFKHWRDEAEPERKREFDLGHAAHRMVLSEGAELVLIEAANYRTKAAQAARDKAYDEGKVPLLEHEREQVERMGKALFAHPYAGALFEPGTGNPEQALIWQDEQTGVWCRALLDWLPNPGPGRFLLRDYKHTSAKHGASPDKVGRTMADLGYHFQLFWHLAGCRALGLAGDDAAALLVVQESKSPYLVTVAQPDQAAMRMAAIRCREALEVYAQCSRDDRWPSYSDDVVMVELPPWETRELNGVIW